ncbi:hypothetical protein [Nocardia sp. NPDC059239]|uniref:hypothetical protein n=1 Tax=unclassified Nocardia TaxID=2637762 RepID=UPI003682629D
MTDAAQQPDYILTVQDRSMTPAEFEVGERIGPEDFRMVPALPPELESAWARTEPPEWTISIGTDRGEHSEPG